MSQRVGEREQHAGGTMSAAWKNIDSELVTAYEDSMTLLVAVVRLGPFGSLILSLVTGTRES